MAEVDKMELRLISPEENGFLTHIEWNRDEIRRKTLEKLEKYKGIVYTDANMKEAKKDLAELRGFVTDFDDRKKLVKKKIMEPYDQFEAELKDVLKLIQEPISLIDKQIKEYEDQKKAEKKADIKKAYEAEIGEMREAVPFERLFDSQYLLAKFTLKKAREDISGKIDRLKSDFEIIDKLESNYKINAKDMYIKTLDLSSALAEERRLVELEEKLKSDEKKKQAEKEARERREAAEKEAEADRQRKAQEAAEKKPVPVSPGNMPYYGPSKKAEPVEKNTEGGAIDPFAAKTEAPASLEEKKYKARFFAVGTLTQLNGLKEYMNQNGIKFGKVEK
ncbi:DUF1351 domain-containing protein [Enterocloster bolteae]|uniref:DUF1351 domain-containing protein n=1 Tax=Enterocloster bolteae TaxID=208479 RepID=UPI002A83E0CE|nr:DUF1351 domain-containing protein [Enterocloster bolteae]